jgi:hypothetical protein
MGRRAVLRSVVLVGLCLGSIGCTTSKMNSIMSSWEGAHINEVIRQWGYPAAERQIAGRTVHVWERNVAIQMPATTTMTGNVSPSGYYSATAVTTGGGTLHGSCRRSLEVDASGYVVSWQWEGNNCPFAEMWPYSNWRRNSDAAARHRAPAP